MDWIRTTAKGVQKFTWGQVPWTNLGATMTCENRFPGTNYRGGFAEEFPRSIRRTADESNLR